MIDSSQALSSAPRCIAAMTVSADNCWLVKQQGIAKLSLVHCIKIAILMSDVAIIALL